MKIIELVSKGLIQVDPEDLLKFSHWEASISQGYVCLYVAPKVVKQLHRLIMPHATTIDHIDGNGLNNSRSNLRECTHRQNLANRPKNSNNTSGYKGVYRNKKSGRWVANIGITLEIGNCKVSKTINLGTYDTPAQAALAYNQAAVRHFGEFARLNEVQDEQ